jgi:GntR family galactonate operon transcriptional repressor
MRSVYEPWAARCAAARRTEEELHALEAAFADMAAGVATGKPDDPAVIDADLRFHSTLLTATRKEFMGRLGALIVPALRLRNEITLSHADRIDFLPLHEAVLEAVRAQDARLAEDSMRTLLEVSARDSASADHSERPA